jgi:type VI secretion system secreted protein VgrG
MTRKRLGLVSVGLVTLLLILYNPSPVAAQVSPGLGNAGSYAVLAGSQVTNTGSTGVAGNVGISPGIGPSPHFTGFGTVTFIGGGSVHDADGAAAAAQADSGIASGALDAQGCTFTYAGTRELAGNILLPGVHCANQFLLTAGTLTLNGAASDVWIFKSASDIVVSGGAAARVVSPSCNVWWRAVSSTSLSAGTSLIGNVFADASITLAAGATLTGRAFARTAAVTLSSNLIGNCVSAAPGTPVPTLSQWAFIMLALLLAAAGAVALRKGTTA